MSIQTLANFVVLPELELKNVYPIGNWCIGFDVETKPTSGVCPKRATPTNVTYDHRVVKIKDEP